MATNLKNVPEDLVEFAENLHAIAGLVASAKAYAVQGLSVSFIANTLSMDARKVTLVLDQPCTETISPKISSKLPEGFTYLDVINAQEQVRLQVGRSTYDSTTRLRATLLDKVFALVNQGQLDPNQTLNALKIVGVAAPEAPVGLAGTAAGYKNDVPKFVRDLKGNMVVNPDFIALQKATPSSVDGAVKHNAIDLSIIMQVAGQLGASPVLQVNALNEVVGVDTQEGNRTFTTASVAELRALSGTSMRKIQEITESDIAEMIAELEVEAEKAVRS